MAPSAAATPAPAPTRLSHEADLERMMGGDASGRPELTRGANPYMDTAQHPGSVDYAATTEQSEVV